MPSVRWPLAAELRRAEANHHDIEILLPRLVQARGFADADDIAAVLHHRVAAETGRTAKSGRSRAAAQMIVGLIPEATGSMSDEMRQAISERRALIEERADAVLDRALTEAAPWASGLGPEPSDPRRRAAWRRSARVVAAFRDRYQISTDMALGAPPATTAQRVDRARAEAALHAIEKLTQRRTVATPALMKETPGRRL